MSRALQKVAVVIPCHNEAATIGQVIAKFPAHSKLKETGLQLKVYVIDNNSSDDTAEVARKAGAMVWREPQKGKGNALRTGFEQLPDDIDYVVMLDGDDTYSPEEIMRVLEPLRSDFCDVVVGSRLGGCIQTNAMSRFNMWGNRFFTSAVRLLYGANISDVLTGYFAWKKAALDGLKPHIKSAGFAIEMEMITKMARLGYRLTSVPISYHPRSSESNLHPLQDGARILAMLCRNLLWRSSLPAPLKIAFLSDAIYPYMKGGKEKRLHEITTRLTAMGHEVHIYTMHWWDTPEKTRQEHGVYLHAICKRYQMYKGDRRTIKEGLLFGWASLKLLRASFDVLDVDHMPFFPVFSAWLVCVVRRRKLYATWHEALSRQEWVNYMGIGGQIAVLIERLSIRLPHCITATSAHTKELLGTTHGRIKRVELVASGIDMELLSKVSPAPIRCDVLYVGRLVKDKQVDKLILAMGLIARAHADIRCVIIGQGLEKTRLQQIVASQKLQKNVEFLNPLPDAADVYAYMKAAKVFCLPSVREGFGIVALESLACGTPVVTVDSSANAVRHLVQDGRNGSIVQLSPHALAEAILRWVSVAPKPSIAFEVADFDWHQIAQKQAKVYMS